MRIATNHLKLTGKTGDKKIREGRRKRVKKKAKYFMDIEP